MNKRGYFGRYGGSFIPEILIAPIEELAEAWEKAKAEPLFLQEYHELLSTYAGRKTPLTYARNLSNTLEGLNLYLKREDLLHTGAHKLNNCLGQCLLAKTMGKKRIIAETGAGQHGVATAAVCAYLGLSCEIYMGITDIERQQPNVKRMRLLGAYVHAAEEGKGTLKSAINAAMRDWASTYEDSHYCIGSILGPHPFPEMVAFFQQVIGMEVKEQCLEMFGKLPDLIVACVGGGSNAIGIFTPFLNEDVHLVGVEAGGISPKLGEHAAKFQSGKEGVFHGTKTYLLQDSYGQIVETSSISAGLDYPAIGPQHAHFFEEGRVEYKAVTDTKALEAFSLLSKKEGIIPALESSHALGFLLTHPFPKETTVVVNLSGRGDKDLPHLFSKYEEELNCL